MPGGRREAIAKKGAGLLFSLAALLFTLAVPPSCRGDSDEERIRRLVAALAESAENRDAAAILRVLAESYSDMEGRGKAATGEMLQEYFARYRGIVIHILATKVLEIKAAEATIETDVALSSGAAVVFRKAVPFSGEFYRFRCQLVRQDAGWLVAAAEWEYLTLEDLFPESLKILRQIFPDL